MLDALKFVRGGVAKKDLLPILTNFRIRDGSVLSYNGTMALYSPIPTDLEVVANAEQLTRAIDACEETISLHITPAGRLAVQSGNFRTLVDCVANDAFPDIRPAGDRIDITNPLLPILEYLEQFMAIDASRPWACGILFDGEFAYATNNIVLVQYWLGYTFPHKVVLPAAAVRELLRVKVEPSHLLVETNRVTFVYETGQWLTTQVMETQWPQMQQLFDVVSEQLPFPTGFFEALEKLRPFVGEERRVYLLGNCLATTPDPVTMGTGIALEGAPAVGCYNVDQMLNIRSIATTIDFNLYPKPCLFYSDRARGLICGLRV